jgi:hypothetical protein
LVEVNVPVCEQKICTQIWPGVKHRTFWKTVQCLTLTLPGDTHYTVLLNYLAHFWKIPRPNLRSTAVEVILLFSCPSWWMLGKYIKISYLPYPYWFIIHNQGSDLIAALSIVRFYYYEIKT